MQHNKSEKNSEESKVLDYLLARFFFSYFFKLSFHEEIQKKSFLSLYFSHVGRSFHRWYCHSPTREGLQTDIISDFKSSSSCWYLISLVTSSAWNKILLSWLPKNVKVLTDPRINAAKTGNLFRWQKHNGNSCKNFLNSHQGLQIL